MSRIDFDYFKCPEADCPMIGDDGEPCIVQIAEGERRRCPCERKVKLKEEDQVAPPRRTGGLNSKFLLIGGVLLILLLAVAYFVIPKHPGIKLDSTVVSFGPSPMESSRMKTVTIENTGKGKLRLEDLSLESAENSVFQLPNYDGEVIKPKDSKEIKITFHPNEGGPFEETLTIRSNDKKAGDQKVTITGAVAVSLEDAINNAFSPLDASSTILK